MEQNRLFHPVPFWILRPEAIQYLSLNPKIFNVGIPNPKSKLFCQQLENYGAIRLILFHSIPGYKELPTHVPKLAIFFSLRNTFFP